MDFDSYDVARRTRLVEHVVASGLPEAPAAELVEVVLQENRRAIGRAEDPDPVVYAALDAKLRPPSPNRRAVAVTASLAVLVLVGGALIWWWLRPPPQVTVPSSFAYDAVDAAAALDRAGLHAQLQTAAACEPRGLVTRTSPAAGTEVDRGSTVMITAAVAPRTGCADDHSEDRAAAWDFLRFTRGGPAPRFAETVYLVYDGSEPDMLPEAAAVDPTRWSSIQDVAEAATRPTSTGSGMPRLRVSEGAPPAEQCGTPRPATAGDRVVLRLQLLRGSGAEPCPFTVDLYRNHDSVIDAVVIYPGSEGRGS